MSKHHQPEWESHGITVDTSIPTKVTFTFDRYVDHPTLGDLGRRLGAIRSGGTSHSQLHTGGMSTQAVFYLGSGVALSDDEIMSALRYAHILG